MFVKEIQESYGHQQWDVTYKVSPYANIGMGGFLFPAMKQGFRNILLILIINSIHNTNFIKQNSAQNGIQFKPTRKKQSITLSRSTNVFGGVEDTTGIVQATHTRALIFQNRSL